MRRALFLATFGAVTVSVSGARADPPPHAVAVSASLAYAAPLGLAERGGRMSDTTLGIVPLEVGVRYRVTPRLGVGFRVGYDASLPTLCQTAGDCIRSLGSDIGVRVLARYALPSWRRLIPWLEAGFGYEWWTTRLVDGGGHSSRSYSGPIVLGLRAGASVPLGRRWRLGAFLDASGGTFTEYALDTNAVSVSAHVPARAVHGWTGLGVEITMEP